LTTRNVRHDIQVLVTHADVCVARTLISYRCVPCHPWCTHRKSLIVKRNLFSFPLAVNNSIKAGPLVFSLYVNVCNDGEQYETPYTLYTTVDGERFSVFKNTLLSPNV
jgi:hypothetical protein